MFHSNTSQAASNGNDPAGVTEPARRSEGIDRVCETECYYLMRLIDGCLREAQAVVATTQDKTSERYFDFNGTNGSQPLDYVEISSKLDEADECLARAGLFMLIAKSHLRDSIFTDHL